MPPRRDDEIFTLDRFTDSEAVVMKNGAGEEIPTKWKSLDVADQILAIRPGAKFRGRIEEKTGKDGKARKTFKPAGFVEYAADIQKGLPSATIDRNPYNFVAWMGAKPWEIAGPEEVFHDREASRPRISGKIVVAFEAVTPVFIPAGCPAEKVIPGAPRDFFKIWNGQREHYAIPGSSVKGAVRSVFEALTNSRLGVSDDTLRRKVLYRRRASQLFLVTRAPTEEQDGEARECRFCFLDGANNPVRVKLPDSVALKYQKGKHPVRNWRANLFWVPESHYRHRDGKTKIAYEAIASGKVKIDKEDFKRWREMRKHPHFKEWHQKNVDANDLAKAAYGGTPPKFTDYRSPEFSRYEDDLFSLSDSSDGKEPADLLFGMRDGEYLRPFGKNVNLLWPSPSLAEIADPFVARREEDAKIEGSDSTELTFGFIAKGADTHCFRGRVRFTTFWLDREASKEGARDPFDAEILHLASPSNARGKARTLYYQPDNKTKDPPDPGAPKAQLRGRKFYWHQKARDEKFEIPMQHLASVRLPNGPQGPSENPPQKIRPFAAGAVFRGEIHFSNLTETELGALIGSLHPGLLFAGDPNEQQKYGIKIGKGKPRGLGSVRMKEINVFRLAPAAKRVRELLPGAEESSASIWPADPVTPRTRVGEYIEWVLEMRKKQDTPTRKFEDISAIRDLKKLTRFPEKASVRVYPPRFDQYAWSSGWCNAAGGPSDMKPADDSKPKKKPAAMKLARDLEP
jgi:CRISPR/Cas system CSM-associated protein Csm3 (group 7 of RAMP superfamily)